jgi:hypothetical protein
MKGPYFTPRALPLDPIDSFLVNQAQKYPFSLFLPDAAVRQRKRSRRSVGAKAMMDVVLQFSRCTNAFIKAGPSPTTTKLLRNRQHLQLQQQKLYTMSHMCNTWVVGLGIWVR